MSDHRETRSSIMIDGTPDQCVGCHTPFLRADPLAEKVLSGSMTLEEATQKLNQELETACRYGRAAVRAAGEPVSSRCMIDSFPSIAGMESFPPELMSWDEWL